MEIENWKKQQFQYWNSEAEIYDSLYLTKWATAENKLHQDAIAKVLTDSKVVRVLDLGCGTGLAFEFIVSVGRVVEYVGIDISPSMVTEAKRKHPGVEFQECDFENYMPENRRAFDLILATFGSLAYTEDLEESIRRTSKLLRSGGVVVATLFNSTSLKQRLARTRSVVDMSPTRHSKKKMGAPHHLTSIEDINSLLLKYGFRILDMEPFSVFGGVCEIPLLWRLDRLIVKMFPSLSYMYMITFKLDN